MKYRLCWSSVDGAASGCADHDLAAAIALADEAQERANTTVTEGVANAWDYRYSVRDRHGRVVHRAAAEKARTV